MTSPPRIDLTSLDSILARRPNDLADRIRRVATDVRPCVHARSTRISKSPLRVGRLQRVLGRKAALPTLPAIASKFGGEAYRETSDTPNDMAFLGQINFAEVVEQLDAQRAAIPGDMPRQGLLAIDMARVHRARIRWYPSPDIAKHRPLVTPSWGRYEAALSFSGGWSLQGLDWFADVPEEDRELTDAMIDFHAAGVDDDDRIHKLFGHTNEILNEFFDSEVAKPGAQPADYRLLWRINFDNSADFGWGTNWLYVVIHADDLAQHALERAVLMTANA